jgi:hypothetical protein
MALADNLVAYLNLDESNNGDDAVVDYHKNSNANDMRDVFSAVGADSTGQPNNAGNRVHDGVLEAREYFDTINDAGDYYQTSTGPFSFSLWFTCDDFEENRHLLTRWVSATAAEQEWRVAISGPNRKPFIGVRRDAATAAYLTASDVTVYTGTLYFLAGGYDVDSDTLWLSANGESKHTAAGPGGHMYVNKVNIFTLGSDYLGLDSLTTHNGRTARLGFWEKVLSDAELTQLYNSGNGLKYPFAAASSGVATEDGSLGPGGRSKLYMLPFNIIP